MAELAQAIGVQMEYLECGECGIPFCVPRVFLNERRKGTPGAERGWYCPNGHAREFSETENDRLRKEVEAAKRDADWQRQLRDKADKALKAQKREMGMLKKRIGNGVCPCCHRTFVNMQRHMKSKHPDYKEGSIDG